MDDLRRDADRLAMDLVRWRRELHRRPELGFEEHRTAAFVVERLGAIGFEVRSGIAGTGVTGRLAAKRASRPPVLLRADLDALPIQEEPDREYRSEVAGAMHACGHDGHVAMLLGAASLLAARRDALPQDVTVCFQPAEEGLGGAKAMIEAGVLRDAGAGSAFALHLWTPYPSGTVHVRPGPIMAAQDEFLATVTGRGGHGAQPHLAADPIVAAAAAIVQLQSIVSRSVDPMEPAVVSVGSLHAGSAPNVIPDEARLHGTLRSFHEDVRLLLRRRVQEVLEGATRAAGCGCDVTIRPGYPAVVNHPEAVERVGRAGRAVFGPDGVVASPPLAASEDFAYFLSEVPGAFALLGAGGPGAGGLHAPHHSPRFDFDETVLPRGAELLARLVLDA